jgi:hypothetical protein
MGRADFFLATSAELAAVFKGWKRAAPLLAQPITLTVTNPFTKESKQIRTWIEAEPPTADPGAVTSADLRGLHCIDQKGVMTTDVVDLAAMVMEWDLDRADSEVHGRLLEGPPHATAAVCEVPPVLVERLTRLSTKELALHGRTWAARHGGEALGSASPYLPSREAALLESEWTARLFDIAELAKRAVAGRRGMFLCLSF